MQRVQGLHDRNEVGRPHQQHIDIAVLLRRAAGNRTYTHASLILGNSGPSDVRSVATTPCVSLNMAASSGNSVCWTLAL